jgi:hypothetical protein
MRLALDLLIVVAVVVGFVVTRRPLDPAGKARRRLGEPGLWLGVVTVLIFVNQVFVNIYLIRVHGGDPSYIARYLPSGYFQLADHNHAIGWLARNFPDPALLAPSVMRVPALLELPFGLLAYLTVSRWFDDRLFARLTAPAAIWSASIAYSVVFGLVEWDLRNPYTWNDLAIRGLSCVATPLAVGWMVRRAGRCEWRTSSAAGLLAFAGSAAAIGVLVLTAYDSVLLYNLGRVAKDAPIALAAAVVLTATRLAARKVTDAGGPMISVESTLVARGLALFFIPALPIRYGIQFGTSYVSLLAAAAIVVTAAAAALRAGRGSVLLPHLAATAVAATAAAMPAFLLPARYQEIRILAAAAIAITAATAIATVLDRHTARTAKPASDPEFTTGMATGAPNPQETTATKSHHDHVGAV